MIALTINKQIICRLVKKLTITTPSSKHYKYHNLFKNIATMVTRGEQDWGIRSKFPGLEPELFATSSLKLELESESKLIFTGFVKFGTGTGELPVLLPDHIFNLIKAA